MDKIKVNNVCIGRNAGIDITDQDNQVRIGNFDGDEVSLETMHDVVIIQDGRVIIKKDVLGFIGSQQGK